MANRLWSIYRKIYKLPKMARIEACSLCQLNCRDCYMRANDPRVVIGKGFLTLENFKKFIKLNPYIEYVELSLSGEIFLNPELTDIIKYSYEKGINLTAVNGVNFNTVSEEQIEALVKYQFMGITFSIDGTSSKSYEIYRRNGNFNQLISNIKKLNYYKEKYNSIYPLLEWQYILFKHNTNEIENIKSLGEELKIENIFFKEPWNGEVLISELDPKNKAIIENITENNKEYKELDNNTNICHQIYISPQINWNGEMLGCCCSIHNTIGINAFKYSLKKCINSKKMKYIKKVITGKKEADSSIFCHHCVYLENMKATNKYVNTCEIKFL